MKKILMLFIAAAMLMNTVCLAEENWELFAFDGFEDTAENVAQLQERDGITYIAHAGNSATKTYYNENTTDNSTKVIPPEGYSFVRAWTNDADGGYVFKNLLPNFTREDIGRKIRISMKTYIEQMTWGSGNKVRFKLCFSDDNEKNREEKKVFGSCGKWSDMEAEFEITENNLNYNKILLLFANGSGEIPMWTRVDAVSVSVTSAAEKNGNIKLEIDGKDVETAQPLRIRNDRLMLPAANLFEALGGKYEVSADGRSICAEYNNYTADIRAESETVDRSGYKMGGMAKAAMIENVLYIPQSTFKAVFKARTKWDGYKCVFAADTSTEEIRRNVPVSTLTNSSDLNDLHFDTPPDETEKISWDDVPEGEIILNETDLLNSGLQGRGVYGTSKKVDVSGQIFEKAVRVTCTEKPQYEYNFQLCLPQFEGKAKAKDVLVADFYVKADEVTHEDGCGVMCVALMSSDYSRIMSEKISVRKGSGWKHILLAAEATEREECILNIEFGYRPQVVEIGGFKLRNLKNAVQIDKLDTQNYKKDAINAIYDKDAQWRKDAMTRIEQYRKGDIKVVAVDSSGRTVKDADVKVSMYEHEFEWGNAFTPSDILQQLPFEKSKHLQLISSLFNTGVAVGNNKRTGYEHTGRFVARQKKDALAEIGIKNFRGHAVYFGFQDEELEANYKNEAFMRKNLWNYFDAVYNDYGDYDDWDIMNEVVTYSPLRDFYGVNLYKEWFAYAREKLRRGAILNYNETDFGEKFGALLNEMESAGVDYDSIGIQSHFRFQKVEDLYNLFQLAIDKGKRIRITEFDIDEDDPILAGGFVRDYLILAFSCPNVDSFISWGFQDGGSWLNNGPYYYDDEHIKPGGEQYIDLVYNKWWTRENGTTDENGEYRTRGYYGDYDITVSKAGKSKTVRAKISKNNSDNTVVVKLDIDEWETARDYNWEKVCATEFNAVKSITRDENGNVLLDGEIAPTQNYPGGIGSFDGFQSADGVIFFNPGMLENGKKLVKTEKGITACKSGENGYIMDTAILMATSDTTKNGGGSLLQSLGDGEWYKVTADVAVGGADLEGHKIPVTVSSTNKMDWADAFVAQWGSINRLSQEVKISTAKSAAELKDDDFTTLTYYIPWWAAGEEDWKPKNIGIGVVPKENPRKDDGSIPKEYGEPYFNESGDYFITLRRVIIEKGTKIAGSGEAHITPKLETMDDGYMVYLPYYKENGAKALFAVYDGEGRKLKSAAAAGTNRYFKADMGNGEKTKCFVWKDLNMITPICESSD